MNKQQILNITGLTEKEFYNKYPDQESFCNDYPQACQQLAQAAEGIQVTSSLTSPEEVQKLGKAYGFRTDSSQNFQQDMYNYVAKNKPELFKQSINRFGPANAGLTNYGSVQGYRPDAYIGPRVADMMGRLGTPKPQAPVIKQPQPPKYVEYSNANVRQQYDFNRGMQQKYVGSNVAPTPIPSQPAMPATFPGQQPVASFSKNPAGGWNIGPAQAPSQSGSMPARQQGAAPAQGGQPQMSHMGPWHTNQQGEYTRYYTNTPGDMNPGVQASAAPSAAPATQQYGGSYKDGGNVPTNPALWSRAKAAAKSKYDVYPSAYANGFAAKWYKSRGGGWRKAEYGMEVPMMAQGGEPQNAGFQALPDYVQEKIMNNMAEGGEQDETQASIMTALKQGMKPQEILKKLVAMGLTKAQAAAYIKSAVEHPASQYDNTYVNDSNYDYMAEGGEPNGGMALGQMMAVADKMSKLSKFVTPDKNLDPWIASKLAVMDDSAAAIADYMMYNPEAGNEQEMDEMKNGGYVVRRSHDRKGKTHVVIGPDGTKKYFGDPNMGERGKSKYGKEAFYARHKKNLEKNPYFRAYARATWEEGGEIEDQSGGVFADGGIHLDPAKKGTFKAQATRMGMSVQAAAAHILANKEDYSPAMVKKANFARNFAKEEGGPVLETFLGGGPYKNVVPFVSEDAYLPEGYATGPVAQEAVEPAIEQSKPIDYKGVSIVDLLNSVGKTSGYASRKELAKNLGISNYRGTAAQNSQLIKMILQDSSILDNYQNVEDIEQDPRSFAATSKPSPSHRVPVTTSNSLPAQQPAAKLQDIYLAIHPEMAQQINSIKPREQVISTATSAASKNLKSQRASSFDDSYVLNKIASDPHSPANVASKKRKQFAIDLAVGTLAPWLAESALMAATSKYLPYGLTEIPQVASSLRAGQKFLPQASKLLSKGTPKNFVTASGLSFEMGGQPQYKQGGYIGMDGKFHMAKGSGTFSGNAYYVNGGEEDPNLTAPYDGSNPNVLPPFDPSQYQAMQLPTGYTGYSKKDPATGQFVPIENVRKDDLWKHLSGSQKWNTGQTATQKVGRAIGDVGNAVNYGIAAAGAYSNYLQNNERENEYNNYMQNMGTTASLYGPSATGTSRGDYSVTGSSYGQFRPNQMGNMSAKGMTQGTQFSAYGGQTMYTIGGGVFDALLTDADVSSPVVYNPLDSMPAFRKPNAVDNTYTSQSNYRLSGLPNSPNNVSVSESGTDVATKLNNPTNMIYSPWMAKLGAQPSGIKQTDGNGYFAQFPDINTALKAYETQMFGEVDGVFNSRYYKPDTSVDKALRTWSGNGYGGNIYPQIANKTLGELTADERRELIRRQIKNESSAMYSQLKKKGILQMGGTYQEGGIVEMTDTEIKQFLANGGQLEFLD